MRIQVSHCTSECLNVPRGGGKDKYLTLGCLEILTSYSLYCSDEVGLKFALPQQ